MFLLYAGHETWIVNEVNSNYYAHYGTLTEYVALQATTRRQRARHTMCYTTRHTPYEMTCHHRGTFAE